MTVKTGENIAKCSSGFDNLGTFLIKNKPTTESGPPNFIVKRKKKENGRRHDPLGLPPQMLGTKYL